jgi:Uma2 family endonuclease
MMRQDASGIFAMVMQSTRPPAPKTPIVTWDILPDTYILPDDPVEHIQQPLLSAGINDALGNNGRLPTTSLNASNFALVSTVNQEIVVKAPDWLYVHHIVQPRSTPRIRRSYTPWAEGEAVAIVMEFLSDTDNGEHSSRSIPPYGKFYFYEQILKVPTYVIFDPEDGELEVHQLVQGCYQITPKDENNQVWIPELELFLGSWFGKREQIYAHWLRWWDGDGNLLLWSSEQAEQQRLRAEEERTRADLATQRAMEAEAERDRLVAKLQELGVDPTSPTS